MPSQIYQTIVIVDANDSVIGTATLFVEQKFIHEGGKQGHGEDVAVLKKYRGQGLGKLLVQELIRLAKDRQCYKVLLTCSEDNVPFYEACGFKKKEIMMCKYFE